MRLEQEWARKEQETTNKTESNGFEVLTVQRLSSSVNGKCQKYSRIGQLTMVPLDCKATLQSIKEACKKHFQITDMECDVLCLLVRGDHLIPTQAN